MKFILGNPFLQKTVTSLAVRFARLMMGTIRAECLALNESANPWTSERGNIFCLWHEMMFAGSCLVPNRGIRVLVSQSRDGEIITNFIEALGFSAVRGSSTRGAVKAIREMARSSERANLAITPDGPRGPRRSFQPGAVYLASRTGIPLVPLGFAYSRSWRLNSWDRFVVPLPFTKIVFLAGQPIHVPADADLPMLEMYQQQITQAMADIEQLAYDRLEGRISKEELQRQVVSSEPNPNVAPLRIPA